MFRGETAINTRVSSIGTATKAPQFTATAPHPVELNMHANWLEEFGKMGVCWYARLVQFIQIPIQRKGNIKNQSFLINTIANDR